MTKKLKIMIAYVPILHQGYYEFFTSLMVDKIYILGPELIKDFDYLRKEIRALEPRMVRSALSGLGLTTPIELLDKKMLKQLAKIQNLRIIAPREDVTRQLLAQYLPQAQIDWSPIFLRWNRESVLINRPVQTDTKLSMVNPQDRQWMAQAFAIANESSDWWRHVGAVLIDKKGKFVASTANHHLPSDHTPYAIGDVRSLFKRAVGVEMGTALHAEGALIARAARDGVTLLGAKLYVTDFPCPYCARIVAHSGITQLYFARGYAMLDGEEILKNAGIKLIKISNLTPKTNQKADSSILKPYI